MKKIDKIKLIKKINKKINKKKCIYKKNEYLNWYTASLELLLNWCLEP